MSNWQQTMTSLGVDASNLSARLRKMIKDYKEFEESVEEANNELNDPNLTDRKRSMLAKKRDEIQSAMDDMDADIVQGIERFNKNKDSIARSKERMQKYWNDKKGGGGSTVTEQQAVSGVVVESPTQSAPAIPMAASGQAVPKEEKKGYGTTILLGGLLLVLSLGAVNYFKRD